MIIKELMERINVESMRGKHDYKDESLIKTMNIKIALISVLGNELNKAEKIKKSPITPFEEMNIVKKVKEDCKSPIALLKEKGKEELITEELRAQVEVEVELLDAFLKAIEPHVPKQLSEEEIKTEIQSFAAGLGRTEFTKRDIGLFKKSLGARFAEQVEEKVLVAAILEFLK